jgi:hypothetical protein
MQYKTCLDFVVKEHFPFLVCVDSLFDKVVTNSEYEYSVDWCLVHDYLNSNFIEHMTREADSRTLSQSIPKLLRKPEVYYRVLGRPVRSLIWAAIYSVYALLSGYPR